MDFFFFLMWTIFEVFIASVILLLFYGFLGFFFFGLEHGGI